MKKIISKILILAMMLTLLEPFSIRSNADAKKNTTSRAIYVVFDNSGSMYGADNMSWSQATYAMEVFAAMMNFENGDMMKVFPMHNVSTDGNSGSQVKSSIQIESRDDIAQIHNMYTPQPLGTPYTQVNNAANELAQVIDGGQVQEGWLVVLTDGDFDSATPEQGLAADLEEKAQSRDNISVQYLAIGTNVKAVPEANEANRFYSQKAGNTAEVVNELAVISNRIFKRNEYKNYSEGSALEIDIPLSKIIVFAQGKDVKVENLKNKEGSEVTLQDCFEVSCSATDGAGLTDYVRKTPVKDTSLKGVVAIFSDPSSIVEGEYKLNISGADQIKIYYEPNIRFGVELFVGDKKAEGPTITGGFYDVNLGFINQLTGEFIESSKLLGTPEYKLMVNGQEVSVPKSDSAMQSVSIEVTGETFELESDVKYLNDYRDSKKLSFTVCDLKTEVSGKDKFNLKSLENSENEIVVTAKKNGNPLSEEQWDNAKLEVTAKDKDGNPFPIEWDIKKGSEVSTWIVQPKYKDKDMFATGKGDFEVSYELSAEIDGESYVNSQKNKMNINDDKTIVDYLKRYWKHITISLLILILILGYVPPFKRRLPRSMKKSPTIECTAEKFGVNDMQVKGTFEKNMLTTILPYVAEKGSLTFSPAPVRKTAKLKAAKGGGMLILNTSLFAGKENITFNGRSIQENQKGCYRIAAGTAISVTTPEFTYTCIPNVVRAADGSIKRKKRR